MSSPVFRQMSLAEKLYLLSYHRPFARLRELKDQIRRAALSVSNNIARGSAGEVRSMLLFCQRLPTLSSGISNLKSEISDLLSLAQSCSRQTRAWAEYLQNTDIQGQRRLNDKTRQAFAAQRSTEAFMQKLQDIRNAAEKPNTVHEPS